MRTRLHTLALAAVLLGVPAAYAAAQTQPPASESTAAHARLETRLDPRTRVLVEHVIDSAQTAGIPAEPLVDKALEGASKRASPDAILRAVRGLALDLATARQSLGPQSPADELAVGAAALRAGVDTDALRKLRRERPGQSLVIALSVLTDLIASNVPVADATRSVLALTSKGALDEQLVAFRRDVERDIGIGASPGIAVASQAAGFFASRAPLDGGRGGGAPPRKPTP